MDPTTFDEIQRTLTESGPTRAIDALCDRLRTQGDYGALFYALLMKKRFELGVSPIPTGSSAELPNEVHMDYEDAIRASARLVGQLYLDEKHFSGAWYFFNMIGEREAVVEALAKHQPGPDEDLQPIIHLAFYEGLLPKKGFDLILERYGICNAITTLGSQDLPHPPEVKTYCISRLVRALHRELRERLLADIRRARKARICRTTTRRRPLAN